MENTSDSTVNLRNVGCIDWLIRLLEIAFPEKGMKRDNKQSIEDQIVSLSQPQIRPVVRGKAGKPVEFGAKLVASCFNVIKLEFKAITSLVRFWLRLT
jgi:hypothetical protein